MNAPFAPGPVRGWWWRSTQAQRLAVAGLGAALGLALLIGAFTALPTTAREVAATPPLRPIPSLTTIILTTPSATVTSTTTVTSGTSKVDTSTTTAPSTTPTTSTVTTSSRTSRPTTTEPSTTTVEPTAPTTTTDDDVQRDVRVGQPCSPEGASGTTLLGIAVTCVANPNGKLKWRVA